MSGINDFVVKFATVNGSGSASANTIFAKTLFRMGIPVSPKNMVYVGALTALLDIDVEILKSAVADQLKGKEKLVAANMEAVALGRDYAAKNFDCPLPIHVRQAQGAKGKILVSGNDAAGLGALYAGATVCAWYPITP